MDLCKRITTDTLRLGIGPVLEGAEHLVVAFSGGADSSLLLAYYAKLWAGDTGAPKLSCLHVNHMLRGGESDSDEEFCRRRCEELGVPITVRRIDVPAMMAETGLGAEECARNARYGAFADEIARLGEKTVIATAHNADDNLETVLFNLARGGGAAGLSGIPPVRDKRIVRPLLGIGGDEIREFCLGEGIPFVVDSTNKDEGYTRNYIRHTVAPLLKKVNPEVASAAVRSGITLREDEEYLRGLALEAVGKYLPSGTDSREAEIPRSAVAGLAVPVLSRAIILAVASVTDVRMTMEQIAGCRRLITESGTGKMTLPDLVTLEVSKELVRVARSEGAAEDFYIPLELPQDGECVKYSSPEGGFDLYLSRDEARLPVHDENIYKLSINTAVRFDTIYGKVFARSRRAGDTLFLGGTTRKLKKMICDRGIPESRRARLPVICDTEGVLLVPGLPVRGPAFARDCDFPENVLYVLYCLYRRL